MTGKGCEIAPIRVSGRERHADADRIERFRMPSNGTPDISVGEENGSSYALFLDVGGNAADVGSTCCSANPSPHFPERQIVDPRREEVDRPPNQVAAVEDGAVERSFQVADAAADIHVNVNGIEAGAAAMRRCMAIEQRGTP
jgi:hypothetical protein